MNAIHGRFMCKKPMKKANLLLILPEQVGSHLHDAEGWLPEGYSFQRVTTVQEAASALDRATPDMVLLDETIKDGLVLAQSLIDRYPDLPIILIENAQSQLSAVQVFRMGFADLLTLPLNAYDVNLALQQALRRKRQWRLASQMEWVLDAIDEGFLIINQQRQITLANRKARQLLNLNDEDLTGEPIETLIHNQDLLNAIFTAQGGGVSQIEITLDDGHVFNVLSTFVDKVGVTVTMQEITHLKELDQIKTDFVNTVSHDLRSPLTAILGYVELLDRVGPLNDQQLDFIHRIQFSLQSITALIDDLLDLGRIEEGHDTHKEPVSLATIISYTIDGLQTRMESKQQTIFVEAPDDLPPMRGNPVQLRQMAGNLVENAIQYSPVGGTIHIHLFEQGGQLILQISDNGPGIPLKDQPFIFDKFFRGANIPAESVGTGLGLAIVKSIVENHQGRIWVDSSDRQGTTFTIVLPACGDC